MADKHFSGSWIWCEPRQGQPGPGRRLPLSLAIGVSASVHEVKISEWVWPEMPPAPARAILAIK